MTKEELRDYGVKVTQASRTELLVLTYDLTIRYIEDAIEELQAGNDKEFRNCLKHARAFINELSSALDMQYKVSANLLSLYIFMDKVIVKADIRKETDELIRIIQMLKKLQNAFEEAKKSDASGPVMENTQQVYAGLTYSKSALNEDIYLDSNRGFTV